MVRLKPDATNRGCTVVRLKPDATNLGSSLQQLLEAFGVRRLGEVLVEPGRD